jgi:hypothetical protein
LDLIGWASRVKGLNNSNRLTSRILYRMPKASDARYRSKRDYRKKHNSLEHAGARNGASVPAI